MVEQNRFLKHVVFLILYTPKCKFQVITTRRLQIMKKTFNRMKLPLENIMKRNLNRK
jgi:hypothetical protein